jgi:hypothetical protein
MNILSFLEDNSKLSQSCGSHTFQDANADIDTLKNYEVVMYDVMSLVAFEDNRDILMNKQMFKVAILGDIDELDVFKNFRTDGWILADRLDKMPEFLDLIQTKI